MSYILQEGYLSLPQQVEQNKQNITTLDNTVGNNKEETDNSIVAINQRIETIEENYIHDTGNYITGNEYQPNDLVFFNTKYYLCILEIQNSQVNPDVDIEHFKIFAITEGGGGGALYKFTCLFSIENYEVTGESGYNSVSLTVVLNGYSSHNIEITSTAELIAFIDQNIDPTFLILTLPINGEISKKNNGSIVGTYAISTIAGSNDDAYEISIITSDSYGDNTIPLPKSAINFETSFFLCNQV